MRTFSTRHAAVTASFLFALVVAAAGARALPPTEAEHHDSTISELWQAPTDMATRDLFFGHADSGVDDVDLEALASRS